MTTGNGKPSSIAAHPQRMFPSRLIALCNMASPLENQLLLLVQFLCRGQSIAQESHS
jgi:hypothetical protein